MLFLKLTRIAFYLALFSIIWLALSRQTEQFITSGWDKSNHFIAFFGLLILFDSAYPILHFWRRKFTLMLILAIAIECVQGTLPWREFSMLDIFADIVGMIAYVLVRPLYLSRLPMSIPKPK